MTKPFYFGLVLLVLVCCGPRDLREDKTQLRIGSAVLAMDSKGPISIVVIENQVLELRDSSVISTCKVDLAIAQAWRTLRSECSNEEVIAKEKYLDPNMHIQGVGVAFAQPIGEGHFRTLLSKIIRASRAGPLLMTVLGVRKGESQVQASSVIKYCCPT